MAAALLAREAEVGRKVSHPHLQAILAANLHADPPHLVFPYVHGVTAQQILDEIGPLPLAYSLWVIRQAAEALAVVHEAGYRHGDLQPANLLIGANWHVTVIDLGLARAFQEESSYHQQWLTGTLGYAAPELFDGRSAHAAADVYSLGVTLYELTTGQHPNETVAQRATDLPARRAYRDIKQLCPFASTELARLVREMLSETPQQRPTLTQLVARLRRLEMFHLTDRVVA